LILSRQNDDIADAQGYGNALRALLLSVLSPICCQLAQATDSAPVKPVAVLFGENIYPKDLVAPANSQPPANPAGAERARGERLRARVWNAVFEDYTRRRNIAPTEAEIALHIEGHARLKARSDAERVLQRAALVKELKSPNLAEPRRQAAQQHLDTLDQLAAFEAKREQQLRDPAHQKMQQQAERRVAEVWVRQWKLTQALYREFGGRIIFQQAGWEPIDAYRKLLEQCETNRTLVILNPEARAAIYRYFEHRFVYADEVKARFYFEKPYWERTPEEMKAAGF
jgi:hypothetical protein